jgi:CRP/FNR family transcriptional regulator, cyclic AMP receptor protein
MIPLHSMSRPFYDQPLPEFKPAGLKSGETPLHHGWLPVLARVPLFSALSQRQLRHVADLAELRRFKRDAQIVQAGAVGNAFYVIMDGRAEVLTPSGHRRTLQAGDFFGELSLLDGAPRAATVSATEALAAARISRAAFLRLLKEQPETGVGLVHGMVAMIRDMQLDD